MEVIKQVLFCIAVSMAIGGFAFFAVWITDKIDYIPSTLSAILVTFVVMVICEWLFGLSLTFW